MKQTLFLLFFIVNLIGYADVFPDKPSNYITDEANIISDSDEQALNKKLHAYQDSTSNQIFVYIANSLNGEELEPISQRIFHQWGIGQKGKNNGVLISIFVQDHKFRIHTGYGLEGALPDLLTKKIQDEDMRPLFKQNDYAGGINAGIDKLIYYSSHEYSPSSMNDNGDLLIVYGLTLVPLSFLFWIMLVAFKKNKGLKITILIASSLFALIPYGGLFIDIFILIIFGLVALVIKLGKGNWNSSGSSNYSNWSSSSDNSWSSSSSDSSWSSSSDSSSDFGGGGGGDSGGGGSNSDW